MTISNRDNWNHENWSRNNWNSAAYQLSKQGQAYVLVTLVSVSGSTPRNSGTKMVISKNELYDTIGGGHLEHKAVKQAQKMLAAALVEGKGSQHLEHFQLAANLGQCCGGNASVLFECFAAVGVNIMLFGAGHVGKALIPILAQLPCQVTWVDSRDEQFPGNTDSYHNVHKVVSDAPELEVANMPQNSYYIVMTHNHQMDFDITQAILKRADFNYLGLIASNTKWRRFQQRYKHRDIDQAQVARMNCPIGLSQVSGKLPIEVAVSVSAEIIKFYQSEQQIAVNQSQQNAQDSTLATQYANKKRPTSQQGIHWQEFKQLLTSE
jgi:xanthine dehydrogenase accessory factor